jgi:hypothetical protein
MLRLALVLPLMFASPETIIFSETKPVQSVQLVSKVVPCIDMSNGEYGYCLVMTAGDVAVTLRLVDGSPVSLTMWNGVLTYTIWER